MYRRSKHASKRVKVPNLTQAAKSELLVAVKGRERFTIPSIYAQRLLKVMKTLMQLRRRTGKHQNVLEE